MNSQITDVKYPDKKLLIAGSNSDSKYTIEKALNHVTPINYIDIMALSRYLLIKKDIDIILVDLQNLTSKELDKIKFVRKLSYDNLFIGLSSSDDHEFIKQVQNNNLFDYVLEKPVDEQKLYFIIDYYLG